MNAEIIEQINENMDARGIVGSASQSSILFQAGIASADFCLAVTGSDEVNLMSASMAKAMGARRVIARVYSPVFRDLSTFDYQKHFRIDRILSLEHLTALALARGIRNPGSVVVEQFARGGLNAREFVVGSTGKLTSAPLRELGLPSTIRFGTVMRENRMWIASADDRLEVGDRVTVFGRDEGMTPIKAMFKTEKQATRRVIIAGGGETGLHLARVLEMDNYRVAILESDETRAKELATNLEFASVIQCDARRRENLEEERVGTADVFVACTGGDEDNIMLCVEATELGAKQSMAVVSRQDYAFVVDKLGIDLAVSESDVMARQILAYLNEGIIVSKAKLPGGLINIAEIEILEGSPATQKPLAEIGLPDRCLIVAVIFHDYIRVPAANDRLQVGEMAVVLMEEDVIDAAMGVFTPVK